MKKRRACTSRTVFVLALIFGCSSFVSAQRYVDVQAGFGTLQAVLSADSSNRVANPNTIYNVHRGTKDSVYYLTSTLTDWGTMPLHIQSIGAGQLPAFILTTLSDGTSISPMISAKANFTLKGVFLNGVNTLGVPVDRVLRVQNDSITVTVDSCQVNVSSQSFVRVDNTHVRIHLKDCRVSNIYSDWSNARGIDNRGVVIDTLTVEGCSFCRIGYRVYRDGGGILNYAYINHNTFTEIGSSIFAFANALNVTYTNNLAVNCEFLGQGVSSQGRLLSMTPLPGTGQTAYIAHNVFYADTAALFTAYHTSSDTTVFAPWFSDTLLAFISNAGTESTNIGSPVTFAMPPNDVPNAIKLDSIVRWYWRNPNVNTNDASILNVDSIHLVNLAYNTDAAAYTWGSDGKPVGATEWFGLTSTGVTHDAVTSGPARFSLENNYPNPFNPTTTIRYSLSKTGQVTLAIFDIFGREIQRLADGTQSAGSYRAVFDAHSLASGIYFYRLMVNGNVIEAKKMLLLK